MAKELLFSDESDYIKGGDYDLTFEGELTAENMVADDVYIVGNGAMKFPASTPGTVTFNCSLATLHLEGRIGFYIYSDIVTLSPLTFNFGGDASIEVDLASINLAFDTNTMASSTADPMNEGQFYWVDIGWKPSEDTFLMEVNNASVLGTHSQGTITSFDGNFSISRGDVEGNVYIDNLIITNNYDKDLWTFRGLKTYVNELPDAPEEPAYDIKLWLSFAEGADGLISGDPYGTDYCDGEWLQFIQYYAGTTVSSAIPKDFVSTDDNPNTDTKYLTWPDHGGYDLAYPLIKTDITYPAGGFTVGQWLYRDTTKDNTRLPMLYMEDSIGGVLYMNYYATYWTAGLAGDNYVYAENSPLNGWYFAQWIFDYTNSEVHLKVNGNEITLSSQEWPSNRHLLNCKKIYYIMQTPYKDATGVSNLIYSEDLTLNMYTEEYNGTPICNLTQYPTAIAPVIGTHPQSEEIFDGQSFAELTVVAESNGGGTLTYQWRAYTGSAWSDVVGETTAAYTPTATGTYRCNVSNDAGTSNSNSAVCSETEEIDYMEYSSNSVAQATYVTIGGYRKLIPASRASGAVTDYQMHLFVGKSASATGEDIHCEDRCLATFADLRFTTSDGTPLSYWIESVTGSGSSALASVWIKLDSIDTTDTDFYMEYGVETVSASSGDDTWIAFDAFAGDAIDTDVWDTSGSVTVSGGEVIGKIGSKTTYGTNCAVLTRAKSSSASSVYYLSWADALSMSTWVSFRSYSDTGKIAFEYYPGTTVVTDIDNDTNYHIFRIGKDGSSYYLWEDNEYINYISSGPSSASVNKIVLYNDSIYWDWVAVGKFFATEPAWGVFGEEEAVEVTSIVYSESTIKTQGSYALKVVATTDDLNATIVKTFSPALNFTGIDYTNFNIRSSRTGSNIKLGLHDTGGTTTEITPNITSADTFQNVEINLSAVADANKNAIDMLTITIVNADSANTFYIDDFKVGEGE